jgi:hypothetical protein
MRNSIVLRTDGKRIAEHNKIIPIQDAALRFRQVFETEKARSLIYGFLINRGSSALDPAGIMMEPHGKAVATEFLHTHTFQSFISQREIRP